MSEGTNPGPALSSRQRLPGRRIILGVSGGIAAYKSPMLVRRLRDEGADVQVVTTRGAEHFVTATTLQAVSGRTVRNDLWDEHAEAAMGHIELARWAELVVVAPATADLLARLAAGRADDLLCTLRLATRSPVLLAPAMNVAMWEHPVTRRNLDTLRGDGCLIVGPDSGPMACGEFGPGRMAEPADLLEHIVDHFAAATPRAGAGTPAATSAGLNGRHVLITAGPTREAIDPVRYISNHSSGKQGYALACAARDAGARVTLVSGPVALPPPAGVTTIPVTSAREMHDAVMARLDGCDVFIGVAAVADYRPVSAAAQKLKKTELERSARGETNTGRGGGKTGRGETNTGRGGAKTGRGGAKTAGGEMVIALVENPDIIAAVAGRPQRPFVVGFAAETENALAHAREKRVRKGLDLIAVNDVSDTAIGFNSEQNAVTLIWDGGERELPRADKAEVAAALLEVVAERLHPA